MAEITQTHDELLYQDWTKPSDPIDDKDIFKTIKADLIIVGAGCAGVVAAHAAAEQGAKVIVIDKMPGLSARGMDNAAVNSKLQKAAGKVIDEDMIIADLVRFSGNRVHQELVTLWARRSGAVFDHYIDLCEANDMKVALAEPFNISKKYPELYRQYPTAHIFAQKDQKISTGNEYIPTQQAFLDMIERLAKDLGAEFHYNRTAEQLVRTENGPVTGVIAKTDKGYVKYLADRAIVLASGGYSENREMLDAWCPIANDAEIMTYSPKGGNTGDGFKMALAIGAGLQNWPHPIMLHTIPGFGIDLMAGNQSFMHVNRLGKRYQNESLPNQNLADGRYRQPGHLGWGVFDAKYEEDQKSIESGFDGPVTEPMDRLLGSVERGRAIKADTLEDLAKQMGIPEETFVATVNRYNGFAREGVDKDFNKEPYLMFTIEKPPFFALPIKSHLLTTVGGLDCDPDMQVLDRDGYKIEGLYAIGNMMGNFFANEYPLMAPGLSHGRAIVLSYILGEQLGQELKTSPKAASRPLEMS